MTFRNRIPVLLRLIKKEAHEQDRAARATILATAARLPDLLAMRRAAWEAGRTTRYTV